MNSEIKRILRNLDEACTEYGVSFDDAISWYKALSTTQPIVVPKQKKTFEDIAEYTVSIICDQNPIQKEVCLELLCLAHEAGERVLLAKEVLDHILNKQLFTSNAVAKEVVKNYVYEFLTNYYVKQGIPYPRRIIGKKNWRSICFALRNLARTLNPKKPTSD